MQNGSLKENKSSSSEGEEETSIATSVTCKEIKEVNNNHEDEASGGKLSDERLGEVIVR